MANDPKVVANTNDWKNQSVNSQGYRDNIDYSLAIRNATSDAEISQLQSERQNKIDAVYSGKDPYNNVNTSGSYGSTWHPQTATASSSAAYRGVQGSVDSGGTASADQIAASNVTKYQDHNALAYLNARTPGVASVYDKTYLSADQVAEIERLSSLAKEAAANGASNPYYHDQAERIRRSADMPYSGGAMGDEYIPLEKEIPKIPQVQSTFDPSTMRGYLDQWLSAAQQQQTGKIDFATQQAIAELMRTKSDADATFQEQRNQIAVEEAKAKDNQALYAERRGDRGGIGQAQYDMIMATAAQNRLAVNQAQTKLATDTARQISDLRAQGEFEKADALLSLSQQYLSQLISLEQWAAEYNLSVAQFNASLDQWKAEFDMAVADLTGYYNGAPTFKNVQWQTELAMTEKANLAEQGWMFLKAGIQPTASQLAAMGMSAGDAQNYLTEVQITGGISGGGGGASGGGAYALFLAARDSGDDPKTFIKQKSNYTKYGLTSAPDASSYDAWLDELPESLGSAAFQDYLSKLNISLSESSLESVDQMTRTYWPALSQSQRAQVQKLYGNYGYTYEYGV